MALRSALEDDLGFREQPVGVVGRLGGDESVDPAVESLATGLVAAEEELGLGAGLHRALDSVAGGVVLVADDVEEEALLGLDDG